MCRRPYAVHDARVRGETAWSVRDRRPIDCARPARRSRLVVRRRAWSGCAPRDCSRSWARSRANWRSRHWCVLNAISRATANSRTVKGRQGSSTATRPRARRSRTSARSASGRLSSREAVARTSATSGTASAKRLARIWHDARSSRAHDDFPGPTGPVPADNGVFECRPGDAGRAVRQGDQTAGMSEGRLRRLDDGVEVGGASLQPTDCGIGPAGRDDRADAGDRERDEQEPLTAGPRKVQRLLASGDGSLRLAGKERDLGQPPERWQLVGKELGALTERQRLLELGLSPSRDLRVRAPRTRWPTGRCSRPADSRGPRALDAPRRPTSPIPLTPTR